MTIDNYENNDLYHYMFTIYTGKINYISDFKFIDELDINPLLISEKTGEGIAVDGRIKVRLEEAKAALGCTCGCTSCGC